MAQAAVTFHTLPDLTGVDPVSRIHFQAYLSAAHILTRLALRHPQAYSLRDVHSYFARQERFADSHELVGWLVEIWIVRALMYHVEGKAEDAYDMIRAALSISAPRGYFCIFLDEGDLMRPLLESADARLTDRDLSAFVKGLLEAMPGESAKGTTNLADEQLLSEREREVLRCLAAGLTYPAIAERLIISVNTVRYHVKGIYGRLGVSSRAEAIARARETRLL